MAQTQIHMQLDAQAHPENSPQSSPQTSPETRSPTYPPKRARYRTWAERHETSENRRLRKQRIRNIKFCLATTADAFLNGLPHVPDILSCNAPYEETAWQQAVPNEVEVDWDSIYRETQVALAEEKVSWDWTCEWDATPESLAPSRPVSLLLEPAPINLITHSRVAKRAALDYYDADNEPRGRMLQRKMEDKLSEEFMSAAATDCVIDLTGDDIIDLTGYDAKMKPLGRKLQRQTEDELREEFMWAMATGRMIDLTGDDIADLTEEEIIDLTGDEVIDLTGED